MNRRLIGAAALATFAAIAMPAAAQTTAPAKPMAPMAKPAAAAAQGRIAISGVVGAAAVQNVGGLFGGEIDVHVSKMLDVIGEGAAMQDLVSRRRLSTATQVATYLSTQQGKTVTGVVKAPGSFAGGGVRLVLHDSGSIQMYAVADAGVAHLAYQPTFTLAGADITKSLSTFGVTLGSDVTGEVTKAAFGGGFGLRFGKDPWFVDVSGRFTSISTPDQATVVKRVNVGFGIWIK